MTPWQRLLLSDTVAVTRLGTGGPAVSTPPRSARAKVDVRLLPSTRTEGFRAEAKRAIGGPGVKVTVLLEAWGPPPPPESGLFSVMRRVLEARFPGAVVAPVLGPRLSESRGVREAATAPPQ